MTYQPEWEYTQDTCDVNDIAVLSNEMAAIGWEPVMIVRPPADLTDLQQIGDYIILFRRPADWKDRHDTDA